MPPTYPKLVAAVAVGVATCTSCAAKPTPRTQPAAFIPRASVRYGAETLAIVRGAVAGHPTIMVVDTGSGGNAIAGWLARLLKLETVPFSTPTHDPSGREVQLERCDHPQLAIDGWGSVPDEPTAVVDLPAEFEAHGIGALVSPQTLAGSNSIVVLDLPGHELRRVPRESEPPATAASFEVPGSVLCRQQGAFKNWRLTTSVAIDGISTTLEVDTGALGSPLFLHAASPAAKQVLSRGEGLRESSLAASGKFDVVTTKDVPALFGPERRTATVTVMPERRDPHCGAEGRVGLDWLRDCVFEFREESYRLRCATRPR
jgi:hypothetical protein